MFDEDNELMQKIKNDDQEAFAMLVKKYQKPIINFFFKYTWDRNFAEDFTQEVFVRIYSTRKNYRTNTNFQTYIYTIAKNLMTDEFRRRGRKPKKVSLDKATQKEDDFSLYNNISSDTLTPPEILMQTEAIDIIKKAIDELPELMKEIIILSHGQNLKYAEIADILGIPIGTVKSRHHFALNKLKEILLKLTGEKRYEKM